MSSEGNTNDAPSASQLARARLELALMDETDALRDQVRLLFTEGHRATEAGDMASVVDLLDAQRDRLASFDENARAALAAAAVEREAEGILAALPESTMFGEGSRRRVRAAQLPAMAAIMAATIATSGIALAVTRSSDPAPRALAIEQVGPSEDPGRADSPPFELPAPSDIPPVPVAVAIDSRAVSEILRLDAYQMEVLWVLEGPRALLMKLAGATAAERARVLGELESLAADLFAGYVSEGEAQRVDPSPSQAPGETEPPAEPGDNTWSGWTPGEQLDGQSDGQGFGYWEHQEPDPEAGVLPDTSAPDGPPDGLSPDDPAEPSETASDSGPQPVDDQSDPTAPSL